MHRLGVNRQRDRQMDRQNDDRISVHLTMRDKALSMVTDVSIASCQRSDVGVDICQSACTVLSLGALCTHDLVARTETFTNNNNTTIYVV